MWPSFSILQMEKAIVVGLGFGKYALPLLQKQGLQVIGSATTIEKAKEVLSQFPGVIPQMIKTPQDLSNQIEKHNPNLVYIATLPKTHLEYLRVCTQVPHVVCEKPLASESEGLDLVNAVLASYNQPQFSLESPMAVIGKELDKQGLFEKVPSHIGTRWYSPQGKIPLEKRVEDLSTHALALFPQTYLFSPENIRQGEDCIVVSGTAYTPQKNTAFSFEFGIGESERSFTLGKDQYEITQGENHSNIISQAGITVPNPLNQIFTHALEGNPVIGIKSALNTQRFLRDAYKLNLLLPN